MTNNPLVTYNPISQDNSGKRTHCIDQRSIEKIADKTRKTGCSFAIGFDSNTLIVQRFPKGYVNS